MPALETVSLALLTLGAAAILRFVWLDSLRFPEGPEVANPADPSRVSAHTARRLALQAEASRVRTEVENLPRAA